MKALSLYLRILRSCHMHEIKIGERSIGAGFAPFIIAELSGNHNQQLALAMDNKVDAFLSIDNALIAHLWAFLYSPRLV